MVENVSEPAGGRAVLVTGAARGIGWAIARRFAAAGDRVAILDTKVSVGVAEELVAGLDGSGHAVVEADLMDGEAVLSAVNSAAGQLGGLDVLVNNAGIFVAHPITEVDYAAWQEHWWSTLGVNLVGAANVTWCAVRHMKERGGRIVNVSSRGAFRGEPDEIAAGVFYLASAQAEWASGTILDLNGASYLRT